MSGELEPRQVGKILGHPARRRLIELLGARGPLGWKELSSELGIATGALYYHIDTLEGLVDRTVDKRYTLTGRGRQLYSAITANPTSPPDQVIASISSRSRASYLESFFAPRSLIRSLSSSPARASASLVALTALLLLDTSALGFGVRLYYFFSSGILGAAEGYLASVAAILVLSYAASAVILRSRPSLPQLAVGCALSFLPTIALGSALSLLPALGLSRLVSTTLLVFFKAWSARILHAGISVAAAVRVEKSLVVGLILLYATTVVIFY